MVNALDDASPQAEITGTSVGFCGNEEYLGPGFQCLGQQAIPHPADDLSPVEVGAIALERVAVHPHNLQGFFVGGVDLGICHAIVEEVASVVPEVVGDPLRLRHLKQLLIGRDQAGSFEGMQQIFLLSSAKIL